MVYYHFILCPGVLGVGPGGITGSHREWYALLSVCMTVWPAVSGRPNRQAHFACSLYRLHYSLAGEHA